ncbi:MAG TPA: DUF3224 domain-containing protein [Conexibacter sp.]|jgi:hypothetical protein|nr:DUF3224 domain-containing protein [Conexibacter sp.]
MNDVTHTTVTATFEITDWDERPYDEPADGPRLTRATVRKRFSGALEGTSVAELLTAQGDDGRGYVASERVDGVIDGRGGTFVLQHGGVAGDATSRTFGHVVPGSGTGELSGLTGEVTYAHDETGARLTLSLGFGPDHGETPASR